MKFVVTVTLIVLGAVLLVVGLVSSSSWAFLLAAVCSAAAIVILWKAAGKAPRKTFVSSAPVEVPQDWHQSVIDTEPVEGERTEITRDELFPVAIRGYGDMVASEIMPTLETLSIEELEAVIVRERQGLARPIILSRAERLIDLTRGTAAPSLDIREAPGRVRTRENPEDGISL